MAMQSIELENVSRSYQNKSERVKALKGINLSVSRAELFGLIGPDGAGKTSLIRIMTSLIIPDEGNVYLEGLDVLKNYAEVRKMLGYMPGRFSLYQDLSVEENLHFFAAVFKQKLELNYHLIESIYKQLEPFKTRKAGQLSGGMKQKLALCCALIHKPRILFLDEPTTGVDAVSRMEFWEMLKNLKSQDITIFVSTPYMDEATLCDRVALIQHGKILQTAKPQEIIAGFPYKLYRIRTNLMFQLMVDLKASPAVRSCFAFGDSYHVAFHSENGAEEQCSLYLKERGHHNIEIQGIRAGIEDCFMQLMGSN